MGFDFRAGRFAAGIAREALTLNRHVFFYSDNVRLQDAIEVKMAAINVGLESFCTSFVGQGAAALHVDWCPPAGDNEKLAAILAKMKREPEVTHG